VKRNVSYDENDNEIECDIIMLNGKSTALIEVKYKAKLENIKIEELIKRANILKQIEIHKNHNIYLGVAAMSFNKKLAKEIRQAGIATIHHTGKKMVLYDKEVKVF
jgi:Holliday junction resolvase-like predicted endonuclease